MSIQKQGAEEHKVATKEHRKQYRAIARILIIDDESDITLAFRKALRDKGFELQCCITCDPTI
jgi:PleD family two-component response regulator